MTDSGIAIHPVLTMCNFIGKHGSNDGMSEMVVAFVSSKESVQMLKSMIDMFFDRYPGVVSVIKILTVLCGAILGDLGCGEHRMKWKQMKSVGRIRLLAAMLIGDDRRVGLYALYDLLTHGHSSISLIASLTSRMNSDSDLPHSGSIRRTSR